MKEMKQNVTGLVLESISGYPPTFYLVIEGSWTAMFTSYSSLDTVPYGALASRPKKFPTLWNPLTDTFELPLEFLT